MSSFLPGAPTFPAQTRIPPPLPPRWRGVPGADPGEVLEEGAEIHAAILALVLALDVHKRRVLQRLLVSVDPGAPMAVCVTWDVGFAGWHLMARVYEPTPTPSMPTCCAVLVFVEQRVRDPPAAVLHL